MYHVILLCGNYVNIYFFEFINARIFSCQFFKYLQISSALKKNINILPLILSALNLKLSTWRPAPHAHSFLFHFMEKRVKYHLQQFWILSLAQRTQYTHLFSENKRYVYAWWKTIEKFQNLPFFLIQHPNYVF